MKKVKEGDIATIRYRARVLDDGAGEVASQSGRLRLRTGDCGAIGGIDLTIVGMSPGQRKRLTVPPSRAFGERDPGLIRHLPRSLFGSQPNLTPGALLKLTSKSGKEIEVVAREVCADIVTVDANHPLAGMTLKFDLTLLSIEDDKK